MKDKKAVISTLLVIVVLPLLILLLCFFDQIFSSINQTALMIILCVIIVASLGANTYDIFRVVKQKQYKTTAFIVAVDMIEMLIMIGIFTLMIAGQTAAILSEFGKNQAAFYFAVLVLSFLNPFLKMKKFLRKCES